MYSTTSLSSNDDCECCQCEFQDSYGRIYRPGPPTPFFNTMGQPLVYYAELQQPNDGKPKREGNKNCFFRAFKWYTQDLNEMRNQDNRATPNLSGFANWLDTKYSEYLSESERQESRRVSTLAAPACPPCPPGTTRRFPRMRRPTASCQFILHPQNLTRPASTCYQTPPTCPNRSNATMISNDAIDTKKSVVKSRSMTSISHENITRDCIDVITVQEGPTNVPTVVCDRKCKLDKKHEIQTKQEFKTGEGVLQNTVTSPEVKRLQVPCTKQCQLVQRSCDKKCRTKQNFQNLERELRVPSISQKYETRTDDTCISKQENQPDQEVSQRVHEETHLNKEEFMNYVQGVQSQVRNSLCDPNCMSKAKCSFLREMRLLPLRSCQLDNCEENSKEISDLMRKAQDDQMFFGTQKGPNEQNSIGGAIKIETEQICSTRQSIDTTFDRDFLTKEKYTGQMESPKSNKTDYVDEKCPTQKQGTTFPGDQRRANFRKTKEPSKALKVEVECQCPEEIRPDPKINLRVTPTATAPTCNSIVLERKPVHVQEQQSQRTIQQSTKSNSKPPLSYVSKKTENPKIDESCQCSEEDIMQYNTTHQFYRTPQAGARSYVLYSSKRNSNTTTDISCQCSESDIKRNSPQISDQRPQVKAKAFSLNVQSKKRGNMIEVSCECSEENVLQYDTPSQYRRNDFQSSADTACFCPNPVQLITPICNIQRTNSNTMNNVYQLRRVSNSQAVFRNDFVQTSDHSITLGRSDVHDYALFMKIVCADKLNENI